MPPTTVHESKLSARLDGGKTSGMVVVSKAVQMAITKVPHNAWNTPTVYGPFLLNIFFSDFPFFFSKNSRKYFQTLEI